MARALPSLVIGQARVPVPPERRAHGKGDLAERLSPLEAAGARHGDILLIRAVRVAEPARAGDLSGIVAQRLSRLRQQAARPENGRVKDGVEAVLFSDVAELLAALAVAGGARAWWHGAASRLLGASGQGLAGLIAARPETLPTVIRYLDLWEETRAVAARFAPSEVAMLADALAVTWQVDVGTDDVAGTALDIEAVPGTRRSAGARHADPTPPDALVAAARLLASPATARVRGPGTELSVLLRRALGKPGRIAMPRPRGDRFRDGPPTAGEQVRADPSARWTGIAEVPPPSSGAPEAPTRHRPRLSPPAVDLPSGAASRRRDARARTGSDGAHAGLPAEPDSRAGIDDRTPQPILAEAGGAPADPAYPEAPDRVPDMWPGLASRQIETEFGGAFFLWHLIRSLDLPEAAEDWRMPAALGPWALVEGLAHALVQPGEAGRADPVWALLAELDGRRPDDLQGAEMAVPDAIRVPATWFDPPPLRLLWSLGNGALLLHDGSGLPLLQYPCTTETLAETLTRALGAFPGAVATRSRVPMPGALPATGPFASPFAAWLGWMVRPIRARLSDALGCPPEKAALVLRRRATIRTGPAEIDIFFALDQADLPTRRAGLDIDPGWVPALGHIVRFHYV